MIPIDLEDLERLRRTFTERTGLGSEAYRITPRSPWPSELFALFAIGQRRGVKAWLESGTYHGQTAAVLAKSSPTAEVTTVELDPDIGSAAKARLLEDAPTVRSIVGSGIDVLPRLADENTSKGIPTGVFIDGPKGLSASILAWQLLTRYRSVSFVALHDMPQPIPTRAVPGRTVLEEYARWEPARASFWATDDEEYVEWARDMDEGLHAAHVTESGHSGWRPYEHFAGARVLKMKSYGPTAAFIFRGG